MEGDSKEGAAEAGDGVEESGKLEADCGAKFDQRLAAISPRLKMVTDPLMKRPLRPEQMTIREELRQAKEQTLAVRRAALKKLLLEDFVKEDAELRRLGLAYARSGP